MTVVRRQEAATAKGAVAAKNTSKTLVAANLSRVGLYVTNDGEKTVYLALGGTAEAHKGIRLNAEGGSVSIDDYMGIVACITAEGESVITFSEV